MAMVQRGERPPNIKDINDQPPNPDQQISNPRVAPRSKPRELLGQSQNSTSQVIQSQVNGERFGSKIQENGLNYLADGESALPWWQQKNARITELENGYQVKAGSVAAQTAEQPVQRTWVPPLPPPVVMPEAAEAIRRPKPAVLISEDQSASQPAEATDELQRITKIAESGVEVEYNGGGSELNSSEVKDEQELRYAGN